MVKRKVKVKGVIHLQISKYHGGNVGGVDVLIALFSRSSIVNFSIALSVILSCIFFACNSLYLFIKIGYVIIILYYPIFFELLFCLEFSLQHVNFALIL